MRSVVADSGGRACLPSLVVRTFSTGLNAAPPRAAPAARPCRVCGLAAVPGAAAPRAAHASSALTTSQDAALNSDSAHRLLHC